MATGPRDDPVVDRLLAVAAIAGGRFRLNVVGSVLGLDARDYLAAVDRAVRAGIFVTEANAGEGWFADEAARRTAERRLGLAERADLHARIAEVLEAEPGVDDGEIARHLSAAVAATVDPVGRARLQVRLAAHAVRDGDLEVARAAARAGMAVARSSGAAELLADAASILKPVGDSAWDGDVYQWCVEALTAPNLEEGTRVRLLARKTQAAAYSGRWQEALVASKDALRLANDLDDPDLVVEALTARQLATSGPDEVDELSRLADRMVDLGTSRGQAEVEMWGRLWRIDALWFVGNLTAIEAETTRLASCVGRGSGPYGPWHLLVSRAALSLARAEFDQALLLMDEAVDLFGRIGHPAAHGASVAFRMWLGHHHGHDEELLGPEIWELGTMARWGSFARLARAFVLADSGRADEAAVLYQRCGAPQGWVIPPMARLLVWATGARVAAAVGADDDVRYLRGRLETYRGRFVVGGAGGTNCLGPVELTLGVCSSALGDWDEAREDLRRAGVLCRDVGAPGLRVEAECLLAEAVHRSGDPVAAGIVAGTALPMARGLAMSPWVERLERLAVPGDPLSPRERQVAALVAEGLGNRDIAATLVISERTAQNHVQHILGKLGFANRAQIAAWAERTRTR